MSSLATNFAASLILASAVAAVAPAGTATAQDAEAIRAKCIGLSGNNAMSANAEDNTSRYRTEVYINCMRQHGLKP